MTKLTKLERLVYRVIGIGLGGSPVLRSIIRIVFLSSVDYSPTRDGEVGMYVSAYACAIAMQALIAMTWFYLLQHVLLALLLPLYPHLPTSCAYRGRLHGRELTWYPTLTMLTPSPLPLLLFPFPNHIACTTYK